MKWYNTKGVPNSRVDVADALRGLAVAGIILYHSVEQFNIYQGGPHTYSLACDQTVASVLQWLLSCKMYGIFALLFGFSFFIQNDNQQQKGNSFAGRFALRMFWLLLFGLVNTAFYDGDILMSYAVMGLLLIPLSYLPTGVLLVIALLFFIQPVELYSYFTGWRMPMGGVWKYYGLMADAHHSGTFIQNTVANLKYGQLATFFWSVMVGRQTQIFCLFILGLVAGRKRLFYNEGRNLVFWMIVALVSIVAVLVISQAGWATPKFKINSVVKPMYNFSIMTAIISIFILLWYRFDGFKVFVKPLQSMGKMSLSNYLAQSVIGCFIFCNYGFGLHSVLDITYSFLVGIFMVVLQCSLSMWWLDRHTHGPLEGVWKKLTWLGKKQS